MQRHVTVLAALVLAAAMLPLGAAHDTNDPVDLRDAPVAGTLAPHCPLEQDDAGSGGDAPNGRENALTIGPGTYDGCVDGVDGADWYRLPVSPDDRVRVTLTDVDCGHAKLALYRSSSSTAPSDASSHAECGTEVAMLQQGGDAEAMLLEVNDGTRGGHHDLLVERGPDLVDHCALQQDDAGSGGDAEFEDPVAITAGSHTGCLDGFDTVDSFTVAGSEGDTVHVEVSTDQCGHLLLLVGGGSATDSNQDERFYSDELCRPLQGNATLGTDGFLHVDLFSRGDALNHTVTVQVASPP